MYKKILALLIVLISCLGVIANDSSFAITQESVENTLQDIELFIDQNFEKLKTPGLSVCIIIDGQPYFINRGVTTAKGTTKVTENTNFEICSLSKAFTGTAIRRLEIEGVLSMDDAVSVYIEGFHGKIQDQQYEITIADLLSHKSGISSSDLKYILDDSYNVTLRSTVNDLAGIQLSNIPGEVYEYTSVNYDVLGAVIEEISGMKYADYVHSYIFEELRMSNSFVATNKNIPEISEGHKITFFQPKVYKAPLFTGNTPAGYIISNTNDMSKWAISQFSLDDSVLSSAIKASHNPSKTSQSRRGYYYSSGWFNSNSNESILNHSGSNPGFGSYISINKSSKNALVVLGNSNSTNIVEFAERIESYLYGQPFSEVEKDAGGLDTTFSILTIIFMIIIIFELIYIMRIVKKVKSNSINKVYGRKAFYITLGYVLLTIPVLIGLYLLPKIAQNTSWYMLRIWTSSSVLVGIITIASCIVLSYCCIVGKLLIDRGIPLTNVVKVLI